MQHGFLCSFALADSLAGIAAAAVAWGDYDNDNDLDILLP
jgi:hypothetical protein